MNLPTTNATMSSREIADITGKPHNDVLKAIRTMEPAWENVNGGKFSLVEYKDAKGQFRPMYQLNKTECLYVATKFNDEARARLVLRWEALERNGFDNPETTRRLDTLEQGLTALMGAMTSLTNIIAQGQSPARQPQPSRTLNPAPEVVDARHLPFDFKPLMGENIRHIAIDEKDWYSLNDVLVNMRVKTGSGQVARKLPQGTAAKIWLYGNTHPAWFVSRKGIDILMHGSRKLRNNGFFNQTNGGLSDGTVQ